MTKAERQEATRYIEHQMQAGRKPADVIAALERQGFEDHQIRWAWDHTRYAWPWRRT
jgi:hypothetical protein